MDISYRRRMSQSFMILEEACDRNEVFELTILSYNKIAGLLSVDTEISDGKVRFWYDITGKQSLAEYLTRKQMDGTLLLLLVNTLEALCQTLGEYLLDEQSIVLEPECIYLNFDQDRIEYVYLPGVNRKIGEDFQRLMELILRRLDHSDKLATVVAYELYQLSLAPEIPFDEMIQKAVTAWHTRAGEQEHTKTEDVREEGSGLEENELLEEDPQGAILEENKGKKWFLRFWEKSRGIQKKEQTNWDPIPIVMEESPVYAPQETDMVTYPTEVLYEENGNMGILRYQGKAGRADISIDKPVFLIGKNEKEVDGVIDSRTISRIHARIEQTEDVYYIEDLNSTNGTRLNGEPLEYRQKERLEAGDKVTFGVEEYIFS